MNKAEIYTIPDSKQYWLIKTDSGTVYDHFIKFGLMAIGHLDVLDEQVSPTKAYYPKINDIKQKLLVSHNQLEKSKGHTTSCTTQINTFVHKMNVGDWVIAKRSGYISIGRITSSPYIDKNPCSIREKTPLGERVRTMNYLLRRTVVWGPKVNIEILPSALKYSLNARQALYSLDKHKIAIHHLIYPFFQTSTDFHMSFRITKTSDINNYSVTRLLLFLNELEVICKTFDSDYNNSEFEKQFQSFVVNSTFSLTTKAGFYSEGDIWAKLGFDGRFKNYKKMGYAVIIYAMLFGNNHLGMDGIFDLKSRQRFLELVAKRFEVNNISSATKALQLKDPDYETYDIESDENDEDLNTKRLAINESAEGDKNIEFDFK